MPKGVTQFSMSIKTVRGTEGMARLLTYDVGGELWGKNLMKLANQTLIGDIVMDRTFTAMFS